MDWLDGLAKHLRRLSGHIRRWRNRHKLARGEAEWQALMRQFGFGSRR